MLIKYSEGFDYRSVMARFETRSKSNENMPPNTVLVQLRYANPINSCVVGS